MNIAGKLVARKEEEEEDDDDDEAEEALNRTEAPPIDLRHNTLGTALPIDQLCSFIGKDISSPSELTDGPLRFEKLALFNHHARRISNQSCKKPSLVSEKGVSEASLVDEQTSVSQFLQNERCKPTPEVNFRTWITLRKWEWEGQKIERFKRKHPIPLPENDFSNWITLKKMIWKLHRKQKRAKLRLNQQQR